MATRGCSLSALFAFSPAAGAACGEGSFGSWPVTAETATKHKIAEATIMIETKQAIPFPVEPIVTTPLSLLASRPSKKAHLRRCIHHPR